MNEADVMMVMDTMAQMFETLVKRIEATERKLEEQCSCKKWANDLRPGAVFEPRTIDGDLTQEDVDELLKGVTED